MSMLLLSIAVTFAVASAETYETISTPSGKITGVNVPVASQNIVQFRNIPFAKPPVGDLRFKKPQPADPWGDVYDATEFGPSCFQNHDFFPFFKKMLENEKLSEDCLYLNIYVPNKVNREEKKAVMVWIHGGGFVMGQGSTYNSSLIALFGDVIVVTINYRLGVFGFISTEDSASPGNYGLWDQIMALKWVQKNIAAFGGDPDLVTIFGESSGSFSVTYLMMIPENKGLFHRGIAQSGVGLSIVPFCPAPLKYARAIGERFNCTGTETFELMECIKKLSASDLMTAQDHRQALGYDPDHMTAIAEIWVSVDGELFKREDPAKQLRTDPEMLSFYKSVDLIAGHTDAEGVAFSQLAALFQEKYNFNFTDGIPKLVFCEALVPLFADGFYDNVNGIAARALCDYYQRNDPEEQGRQLSNLAGDVWFVTPTTEALNLHTKENDKSSFRYVFSKQSPLFLGPPPKWDRFRSTHGTDLEYLFTFKTAEDPLSKEKEALQLFITMVKYWTNFAKTGDPNGEGLPYWPRYEEDDKAYINLNETISTGKDIYADRVKLLSETIPDLLKKERAKQVKSEL